MSTYLSDLEDIKAGLELFNGCEKEKIVERTTLENMPLIAMICRELVEDNDTYKKELFLKNLQGGNYKHIY
jgi:hypothetical protein